MSVLLTIAALVATTADDGAVVRCALGKMPAAELAAAKAGVLAGVTGGAKPSARTEASLTKLRVQAAACETGGGTADRRAAEIAVASFVVEALSTELQARGANVLGMNGKLRSTAPAVLDALLAKRNTPETAALARDMLGFAGAKAKDPAVERLVGGYMYNAVRLAKLFASKAG